MAQAKKAISKTGGKLAARAAARAAVKTYHNYINGEWVASEAGEMFENINPATTATSLVAFRFPLATTSMPPLTPRRERSIAGATRPHQNAPKCFSVSVRS